MKKLNKKGFTLVELLAVIVILALLIVVVANTALPAMNNAKKKSLVTYTQRMVEKAKERYIVANKTGKVAYTITALTGETNTQYTGYIVINYTGGKYNVVAKVMDFKNNYAISNSTINDSNVTDVTSSTGYTESGLTAAMAGASSLITDINN